MFVLQTQVKKKTKLHSKNHCLFVLDNGYTTFSFKIQLKCAYKERRKVTVCKVTAHSTNIYYWWVIQITFGVQVTLELIKIHLGGLS